MKDNAVILDACCGGKMFYFDKDDPRVLFQDIREVETTLCDGRPWTIKPDIIGDFRSMQYDDGSFSLVVFDPPHLLRNVGESKFADIYGSLNPKAKPTGWQQIKYGALGQTDWQETIRLGFKECFRVLKAGGFLVFKWNETDIPVSKILELTDQKPVLGHRVGKLNKTHWLLFMKPEEPNMEAQEIKKKLNDAFNKIYKAQEELIWAKEAVYEVLVAKAEQEAAQKAEKAGWVSVKDHIPPDDKRVVVRTSAGATYFLHPIGGHFPKDVIEWYELPE